MLRIVWWSFKGVSSLMKKKKVMFVIIILITALISYAVVFALVEERNEYLVAKEFPNYIIPPIMIDSENNVIILWNSLGRNYFLKINENGDILTDEKLSFSTFYSFRQSYFSRAFLDSNDNIYIVYIQVKDHDYSVINCKISYIKLDNNGKFIENKIILNSTSYCIYPSIEKDIQNNLVISWLSSNNTEIIFPPQPPKNMNLFYIIYNLTNDLVTPIKKIASNVNSYSMKTDENGYIHIVHDTQYKKLDEVGNIIINDSLNNISLLDNYPIVEINNNYVYMNDKGCIDSNSNIHTFQIKSSGEADIRSNEYHHYLLYNKLNDNGDILKTKTIAVAQDMPLDGKTSEYKWIPHYSCILDRNENIQLIYLLQTSDYDFLEEFIIYLKLSKDGKILINEVKITEMELNPYGEYYLFLIPIPIIILIIIMGSTLLYLQKKELIKQNKCPNCKNELVTSENPYKPNLYCHHCDEYFKK